MRTQSDIRRWSFAAASSTSRRSCWLRRMPICSERWLSVLLLIAKRNLVQSFSVVKRKMRGGG